MAILQQIPTSLGDAQGVAAAISDLRRRMSSMEAARTVIGDGTVGTTAIAIGSINGALIAPAAISTGHIEAGSIDASLIQAGAIQSFHIEADAINAGNIAAGAIGAQEIAADAITASHIQAGAVQATHIDAGTINAQHIAADAIDTQHIRADAIDTDQIKAGAIEATNIAAAAITAIHLTADAVTAGSVFADVAMVNKLITAMQSVTGSLAVTNGLSAISANIGNITAGTIDGASIFGHDSGGNITFWLDGATGNAQFKGTIKAGSDGLSNLDGVKSTNAASPLFVKDATSGKTMLVSDSITVNDLDAGSITALELTAGNARLGQLKAGAVDAASLSVRMGGGNLLPDSSFESGADKPSGTAYTGTWSPTVVAYWLNSGGTLTYTAATQGQGIRSLRASTSGASANQGAGTQMFDAFKAGTKYTASVYVKAETGTPTVSLFFGQASTDSVSVTSAPLSTLWTRLTVTWTPAADASSCYVGVRVPAAAAAIFYVDNIQVEEGDVATAWKPYIDGTVIDGGSIKLGASTANQAKVVLDTLGLKAYDASGVNTVTISAADGNITSNTGTFTGALFRTAASGRRLALDSTPVLTNLSRNPSVERDSVDWLPISPLTLTRVNTWAYSGAWSARIQSAANLPADAYCSLTNSGNQAIPVTVGKTYFGSVQLNVTTAPATGVKLRFLFYTSAGVLVAGSDTRGAAKSGTGTGSVTHSATAPATAAYMEARLQFEGTTNSTIDVMADAVMLAEGALPATYFDGDYNGYSWTGARGYSATVSHGEALRAFDELNTEILSASGSSGIHYSLPNVTSNQFTAKQNISWHRQSDNQPTSWLEGRRYDDGSGRFWNRAEVAAQPIIATTDIANARFAVYRAGTITYEVGNATLERYKQDGTQFAVQVWGEETGTVNTWAGLSVIAQDPAGTKPYGSGISVSEVRAWAAKSSAVKSRILIDGDGNSEFLLVDKGTVGNQTLTGNFTVSGSLYVQGGGWVRVKGQQGIYFEDYGGGFRMSESSWIRTYGRGFYGEGGPIRCSSSGYQIEPGARISMDGSNWTTENWGWQIWTPDARQQFTAWGALIGSNNDGSAKSQGACWASFFGTYSDERIKKNIIDLQTHVKGEQAMKTSTTKGRHFDKVMSPRSNDSVLQKVRRMRGTHFERKVHVDSEAVTGGVKAAEEREARTGIIEPRYEPQIGFIAQEVAREFPELVEHTEPTEINPDGMYGIDAGHGMDAVLLEALKELANKVDALEAALAKGKPA